MNSRTEKRYIEERAEKYARRGKFSEAIAEYQKLLSGDEHDIPIRNILGDLYIKSNQKDKALEEFQKVAAYYEGYGLYSMSIAIYKRIIRLNPDDAESIKKLAKLFRDQGFNSEAKSEYLKLGEKFKKDGDTKEAVRVYKKILELDSNDIQSRLTLAELYAREGSIDLAVEELNEAAEFQMRHRALKEAKDILDQAKALKEDHSRTLANIIDLLKREGKKEDALKLVYEILKRDKDNIKALHLLGNLYYEEKNFKKAEEIFSGIISLWPKGVEARVKLGKICIQKNNLDMAFELYEPLISTLVRKHKEEKAVGLLGLILESKKIHLPTLEKLASIYKAMAQEKNLEVVYKILLDEYEKHQFKEKMLSVLEELVSISPENEDYYYAYRNLKREMGIFDEAKELDRSALPPDTKQGVIEKSLAKADLYIEQGLIRNARRILENLRIEFPGEPQINQRIEELRGISSEVKLEEIPQRVERATEKETQLFEKRTGAARVDSSTAFHEEEKRLTAADIFAETDIIPLVFKEEKEKKYFDLTERINEELEAIKAVFDYQVRGDTTSIEKPLSEIVSEFREAIDRAVDKENFNAHYNLGIAFMEQGLFDEAIKEYELASLDQKFKVECYGAISFCFRQKRNFQEAIEWIEKAKKFTEEESSQSFALKYELASLLEEMGDNKKAMKLYNEVRRWDAEYRDAEKRLTSLERKIKTPSRKEKAARDRAQN